jgi:hypothetical protein
MKHIRVLIKWTFFYVVTWSSVFICIKSLINSSMVNNYSTYIFHNSREVKRKRIKAPAVDSSSSEDGKIESSQKVRSYSSHSSYYPYTFPHFKVFQASDLTMQIIPQALHFTRKLTLSWLIAVILPTSIERSRFNSLTAEGSSAMNVVFIFHNRQGVAYMVEVETLQLMSLHRGS